jgi:hypothetical protein
VRVGKKGRGKREREIPCTVLVHIQCVRFCPRAHPRRYTNIIQRVKTSESLFFYSIVSLSFFVATVLR